MSEFTNYIRKRANVLADNWFDLFAPSDFAPTSAVIPARLKASGKGRAKNQQKDTSLIATGSMIEVPDNVAAVLIAHSTVDYVITEPGIYIYNSAVHTRTGRSDHAQEPKSGHASDRKWEEEPGLLDARRRVKQAKMSYRKLPEEPKRLVYVNLREITDLPFRFQSPVPFHDKTMDADFGYIIYGYYSLRITNPALFMRNFARPLKESLDFLNPSDNRSLTASVCGAVASSISSLGEDTSYSELPAKRYRISKMTRDSLNDHNILRDKYGFEITSIVIEQIRLCERSAKYISKRNHLALEYEYKAKEMDLYKGLQKEQAIAYAAAHGYYSYRSLRR